MLIRALCQSRHGGAGTYKRGLPACLEVGGGLRYRSKCLIVDKVLFFWLVGGVKIELRCVRFRCSLVRSRFSLAPLRIHKALTWLELQIVSQFFFLFRLIVMSANLVRSLVGGCFNLIIKFYTRINVIRRKHPGLCVNRGGC